MAFKVIYLGAKKHRLDDMEGFEFYYNDIVRYDGIDYCCDMLEVPLSPFDVLIATPPCNYYSRANYRRETSEVAQATKHLLPDIFLKFKSSCKPFLIENVWNWNLYPQCIKEDNNTFIYSHGGHYFISNFFSLGLPNDKKERDHKALRGYGYRDDNRAVDAFIRAWLGALESRFLQWRN